MYLLPYMEISNLNSAPKNGRLYKCNAFCKDKARREKCERFLNEVKKVSGFYTCPYGFTAYVKHQDNVRHITCSLRVRGHFNPKKANPKIKPDDSPVLSSEFVMVCVNESLEYNFLQQKHEDMKEFTEVTLHEIRKLNRDIKSQMEELNKELSNESFNKSFMEYRVQNVYGTSSLLSVRLDTFDLMFNPGIITSDNKIPYYIYKKFDKTIHCLDSLRKKNNVIITMHGSNYSSMDANIVLELLPYVLLENAIKYSPPKHEIKVIFEDDNQTVQIENVGPTIKKNELDRVFERTFRGKHAQAVFLGSGNGLFFAKQVCDLHGIMIDACSSHDIQFQLNKIPYSNFKISLCFPSLNSH